MNTEITDVERHGDHGWAFNVTTSDGDWSNTSRYRTGQRGDGLTRWSDTDCCWNQTQGTLQFDMSSVTTVDEARRFVEQWWRNKH